MFNKTNVSNLIATLGLIAGAVGSAHAAVASTQTYGDIAAPGVYFGAGNVNGNFTIASSNGIELALRAKTFGGATIDGSNGVYQADLGLSPNRTSTQTPRSSWSYEFSVSTLSGADMPVSSYQYRLGVDKDPTAGVNYAYVDANTYWPDNARNGTFGFQNSQNGIFLNTPGGQINPFVAGLFNFDLAAFSLSDLNFSNPLANTNILVRVGNPAVGEVPEPETLVLLGMGMLGLLAARRRKA